MPVLLSANQAVQKIPKGKRIFIGSGGATPSTLLNALVENYGHFLDNEVTHLLTLGKNNLVQPHLQSHFRDNSFFIGENVREAVQNGLADYTPIFLSEIPRLLMSPGFQIEAALVSVSPPDRYGMCSLGISVDIIKAALKKAHIKIAQINPSMPRTFGQTFIPYTDFDYVVEADNPLPELPGETIDAVSAAIGLHVSNLIRDGAVLQMGIGRIPNAVLQNLKNKNDLGIHTEMFSDGVIELIASGIITNKTKKILAERSLTSFCLGTRRLYDFVHENPLIEFYPSDFVNDPWCIAQNDNVVAINSALQVDLTGQVCADSMGSRFYSGIGGQVDFIRGARRSRGGRPIIALPSTAKNGTMSRIVGQLSPGAGVVTSRGDVHYVVTEYGIANLFGKSIRQRAMELIEIAHPEFRDELLAYVKQNRYVYFDQQLNPWRQNYPVECEHNAIFGTVEYRVRPLKITDEKLLQDFFYSHDDQTLIERYFYVPKSMPHQEASRRVTLDYRTSMGMAILHVDEHGSERMVAIGRYQGRPEDTIVELAIVVGENVRLLGMAGYLAEKLYRYAQKAGMKEIISWVRWQNNGMKKVMENLGKIAGNLTSLADREIITYRIKC